MMSDIRAHLCADENNPVESQELTDAGERGEPLGESYGVSTEDENSCTEDGLG